MTDVMTLVTVVVMAGRTAFEIEVIDGRGDRSGYGGDGRGGGGNYGNSSEGDVMVEVMVVVEMKAVETMIDGGGDDGGS